MAQDGDAITQDVYLIPQNPTPTIVTLASPVNALRDCCGDFSMKVLADTGSTDAFKNDVSGFLWYFDPIISAATLELFKFNGSAYASVANLNSNTYGTFYDYAFFINDAGEQFIGYQLSWKAVLTAFGAGSYKVKCNITSGLSGASVLESPEYCLKQFTPDRANGTVKVEYYLNGITGVIDQDDRRKDYGVLNWYNSMRLPGFFGFPDAPYKTEYIQYNSGQRLYVEDDQEPEYVMKLKPVMYLIHEIMRIDVMMADRILITDYNSKNPGSFIQKAVQKSSNYAPDWKKLKSKLAPVEIKFRQEFNNLKKLRE